MKEAKTLSRLLAIAVAEAFPAMALGVRLPRLGEMHPDRVP